MSALLGMIIGSSILFGPIFLILKYRPYATVGDVAPVLIGFYAVTLLILLALIAGSGN